MSMVMLRNQESDPFQADGVAQPVISLALAVGVLKEVEGKPGTFEINPEWFSDPLGNTADSFKQNGAELAQLLIELLGQISGNALGVPAQNLGDLGTWLPIINPVEKIPTDFYLATYPIEGAQIFGIGILHEWEVSVKDIPGTVTGPDALIVRAWGLIPLIKLGTTPETSGFDLVLGQKGFGMQLGIQVEGKDGQAIIDANGFSFTGIKVTATMDLAAEVKLDIALVVLQLQLPTETEPRDRTLSDLANLPGADILSTAATLFITALGEFTGQTVRASYLLPALGLSPIVPNSETRLPLLNWVAFKEIALSDGNLAQPFINWFNLILADTDLLKAWLESIGGLMNGEAVTISGEGTRNEPFQLPLITIAGIGTLSFRAGTDTSEAGNRRFYPGLGFQSDLFLLGDQVAFLLQAQLELAQFQLTEGGGSMSSAFTLNFEAGLNMVSAEGPDKPLFEGEILGETYRFGSLFAGMELANLTRSPVVNPAFELRDVLTPNGEYEAIDLTRFGDLVDQVKAELFTIIDNALIALFGVDGPLAFGREAATLLGIIAPTDVPNWPETLTPPFSAAQLPESLQNPVQALTDYYAALIDPTHLVDEKPAFYYMVQQMAGLFQRLGLPPIEVKGQGTQRDPWRALLTDTLLPGSLSVYSEDRGNGVRRLMFGLSLTPEIVVLGTKMDFSIDAWALGLDLTLAGGTPAVATIFPGVDFNLNLPEGIETPPVANAILKVANANATANWSPYSSWTWSMFVAQPVLSVDGVDQPVGQDMNFSDQDSLESLVTQSASTFAPLLTGLLGVAVYRTGTRTGLALNGILGLLPNLGAFMPPGLVWPDDMPQMVPQNFNDPIGNVREQFKALFNSEDHARAATTLFAYAIGSAENAPDLAGNGAFATPFLAPLDLPFEGLNLDLAVWFDAARSLLGVGLARVIEVDLPAGFKSKTTVRLNMAQVDLNTGSRIPGPLVPGATIHTLITGFPQAGKAHSNESISGTLAGNANTGIQKLELMLGLGFENGLSVTPDVVVTANDQSLSLLEILNGPSDTEAIFYALVNAAIQSLANASKDDPNFQLVYDLLAQLGLTLPITETQKTYGIHNAGWRGMLADPLGYFTNRLLAILADADQRDNLVQVIHDLTGITFPDIPQAALQTLAALGFLTDEEHGFTVIPSALSELFAAPVTTITNSFSKLLTEPEKLASLLDEIATNFEQVDFGPFAFSIREGGIFAFELPPKRAIDIGGLIKISGGLIFDTVAGEFRGALRFFLPATQLALVAEAGYRLGGTPVLKLALAFGDGVQPAPPPLYFWPFDLDQFISDLSDTAPAYALNTFLTGAIDEKVLNPYPLAQAIFTLFGIGFQDENGVWYTKSLLGLFDDPIDWLLGDAVIGQDGLLNIDRIGDVLATIPNSESSNGIGVRQIENGIQFYGLPYNIAFDITAKDDLFELVPNVRNLPLAGGTLKELSFGLGLGPNWQPGLRGDVALNGSVGSTELGLAGGFRGAEFFLSAGATDALFQIVPFPGWQTLSSDIIRLVAQRLLTDLTSTLLDALDSLGSPTLSDWIQRMRTAADLLDVTDLIDRLIDGNGGLPDAAKLNEIALAWLNERLDPENVADTMMAIAQLFAGIVDGIVAEDGLITYTPSESLPVTIQLGVQELGGVRQLGLWAAMTPPENELLVWSIQPTGLGMDINNLTGPPLFNLDLALVAPLDDDTGPKLSLRFDNQGKHFVLGMDPMGTVSEDSYLYRELLPTFFGLADKSKVSDEVVAWLFEIAINVLPRYISVTVLNTNTVKKWLDDPMLSNGTGPKPGDVLVASTLLTRSAQGKYALNSIRTLLDLTVDEFLARFLQALLETEIQVLKIGEAGGIWMGPQSEGSNNFGVRAMVPNIEMRALPNLRFQLGAVDDAWIAEGGGDPALYKPGIAVYVPIEGIQADFTKPIINLINLGVDFIGKQQRPLVELSRFSLGSVEPRAMISMNFGEDSIFQSPGGSLALKDIAISLAPNTQVKGPQVNPVAQNLMGSGTSDDGGKEADNPPVNPGFSLRTAYVNKLSFKVIGPGGEEGSEIWIPVQRSFGPLNVNKVGFQWQEEDLRLNLLFNGSVLLAGLFMGVDKLSVGVPVNDPTNFSDYSFDLAGLNISFNGGGVSITGGFIKTDDPLSYNGQALIKLSKFSINALGSYALMAVDPNKPEETAPSFFAFVNLNIPLGPHPAFFINGIAAGFGYNRNIKIPEPGEIASFPLVAGALNSGVFGGPNATPQTALQKLVEDNVVFPELGQYWLAAGLNFSNFKLLDTFALLFVRFGREFAIDLVGLTSGSLPPQVGPKLALVYMELGLVVSWRPSQGLISARAQLTPNSFLLAKECKLTGGFAAMLWYAGEHSGQFVITFGGYHPAFDPPDFYPEVPRLGFNWPITKEVGISGGVYFALTPNAIMAGGYLKVLFEAGPLRAWLNAAADFLIGWAPFYYMASIGVSVGVAFHTTIGGVSITLKVSLGASLELAGPPTAGEAKVNWYVISFTIPIGKKPTLETEPLSWNDFQLEFLPQPPPPEELPVAMRRRIATSGDAPEPQEVVKTQVLQGLIREDGQDGWVLQSQPFTLEVSTVMPPTTLSATGSDFRVTGPDMGIRPMNVSSVDTPLIATLQVRREDGSFENVDLPAAFFEIQNQRQGAPEALWSPQFFNPDAAPSSSTLENTLAFLTIRAKEPVLKGAIAPIDLVKAFSFEFKDPFGLPLAGDRGLTPAVPIAQGGNFRRLQDTIMESSIVTKRQEILEAFAAHDQPTIADPNLSVIAFAAPEIYQAPPTLARLGELLAPTSQGTSVSLVKTQQLQATKKPEGAIRIAGATRLYRTGASPTKKYTLGLATERPRGMWIDQNNGFADDRRLAHFSSQDPSGRLLNLHPGTVVVAELNGKTPQIQAEGSGQVRVVQFDRHHRVLSDSFFAGPSREVANDSDFIAVQGQPSCEHPDRVGWQRDSTLCRVGNYSLLGDGYLVHIQGVLPKPVAAKNKRTRRGLYDMSLVLDKNFARTGRAKKPGWIETLFSSQIQLVAVLSQGDGEPSVHMVRTDALMRPDYQDAAKPIATYREGDEMLTFYQVPAGQGQAVAVLTTPCENATLCGVWGQTCSEVPSQAIWTNQVQRCNALEITAPHAKTCQLLLNEGCPT